MSNLTMKQKIILGVIIGVMLTVIGIYGYVSLHSEEEVDIGQISSNEINVNNQTSSNNDAVSKDTNSVSENAINSTTNGNVVSGQGDTSMNGYENLEGKIVVHITGEVNKTGILILPEGARIADAIEAAGGARKDADLNEVNLAYELQDGQKIYIPNKKDKEKAEKKAYITSESGNNVIIQDENSNKGESKKVNINTANQSELENLPGIGPSIASRIIEYREKNGKFQKVEDLQNVKGIGDAKFGNVKEYVVVQ